MKLQVPFIQLPITFDAAALLAEVSAIEESAWRGRTSRDDGNSALTLITTEGDPASDALSAGCGRRRGSSGALIWARCLKRSAPPGVGRA